MATFTRRLKSFEFYISSSFRSNVLTLTGPSGFLNTEGTLGVGSEETTPFADSPLIELEPHERNDRVRRYEMQRLVSDLRTRVSR